MDNYQLSITWAADFRSLKEYPAGKVGSISFQKQDFFTSKTTLFYCKLR